MSNSMNTAYDIINLMHNIYSTSVPSDLMYYFLNNSEFYIDDDSSLMNYCTQHYHDYVFKYYLKSI